ncbi:MULTISPECIES: hypothetical protein [Bartonella]|uniref:hypothetical protein n=1 Tax=Bartonella TaxID=773 RepID=UPI002362B966|nr:MULTISPECIES: hypothetical protein [Bartonella]
MRAKSYKNPSSSVQSLYRPVDSAPKVKWFAVFIRSGSILQICLRPDEKLKVGADRWEKEK